MRRRRANATARLGYTTMDVVSGAGHDAIYAAPLASAGLHLSQVVLHGRRRPAGGARELCRHLAPLIGAAPRAGRASFGAGRRAASAAAGLGLRPNTLPAGIAARRAPWAGTAATVGA